MFINLQLNHVFGISTGDNLTDYTQFKLNRLKNGGMPRVLDLFAGCGGMSLGFQKAGCQIIGGIEIDPRAAETHGRNFSKDYSHGIVRNHSVLHDIITCSPQQFVPSVLDEPDAKLEELVDFIVGGPPCQAFARIGRAKLREIMEHPKAFLSDERASLYTNFLEYVEAFKPLAILMENVPDIMNYGGKNIAEEIVATLKEMGYTSKYSILNAAHYGVPQMRQRFYLIAILDILKIEPTFPEPTHYIKLPRGYKSAQQVALKATPLPLFSGKTGFVACPEPTPDLMPAVTAEEAISDLPKIFSHLTGQMKRGAKTFKTLVEYRDDVCDTHYVKILKTWPHFEAKNGVWDHVIRYLPRDYKLFRRMKPGDQYPEVYQLALQMFDDALRIYEKETQQKLDEQSKEYQELRRSIVPPYNPKKFPNKWRKLEADQPARTLTAHIGKDTYSHIHYDSEQARVISVREAARFQSFPDGFRFSGAMNAAFRQIGNAVPPLQAYALAKHIKSLIYQEIQPFAPSKHISFSESSYDEKQSKYAVYAI